MKAMILAAGLGTRLRPLTDDRPKALVEIAGRTLLEITLRRLSSFGVREVIINVHHFANLVIDYLKRNSNFGLRVEISLEDVLLDTGGGLKKAAWFFLQDGSPDEPFLLHNVDVISNIDLAVMLKAHQKTHALATLAVQKRDTSRNLLFDEQDRLCGRQAGRGEPPETVRPAQQPQALAFSGIHVISRDLLTRLSEEGAFSIITSYLRLAAEDANIAAFRADAYYWRDLGKPANIQGANEDVRAGAILL